MTTPTIRDATADDTAAIVALALRAWRPVFESFRTVLGEATYATLYPDWVRQQSDAVTAALGANPTWVEVVEDQVVGFVNVVFADDVKIGEIFMIAVDPDAQRRGVATRLTEHALDQMRSHGMVLATVSTGGDPGHSPARATYERAGFAPFAQVLYTKVL